MACLYTTGQLPATDASRRVAWQAKARPAPMNLISSIGLAAGLAWASGIRLYATLFAAGLLGRLGVLDLPPALQVLEHAWVLGASGGMLLIEMAADKIPGFDTLWDAVHTFIRIPAGAVLAAATLGHLDPVWVAVAAILGGAVATASHAAKAGSRVLINTSPEPFSNWAASSIEDVAVPLGLWSAIRWPILFLVLLACFFAAFLWLVPRMRRMLHRLAGSRRKAGAA